MPRPPLHARRRHLSPGGSAAVGAVLAPHLQGVGTATCRCSSAALMISPAAMRRST